MSANAVGTTPSMPRHATQRLVGDQEVDGQDELQAAEAGRACGDDDVDRPVGRGHLAAMLEYTAEVNHAVILPRRNSEAPYSHAMYRAQKALRRV